MPWNQAMSTFEELGNGWRLPNKEDLKAMYELHKQGKGNFKNEWYWSSSQYDSGDAWGVNFSDGDVSSSTKGSNGQVRAVRAF